MKTMRIATLATVVAGAAVGLASPASAELTDGTYEITYIGDPSPPINMLVTSCGAGCKHTQIAGAGGSVDFHLHGNTWTGQSEDATVTIDNDTLRGSSGGNQLQLAKVG
jgi:hypothetical protein